MDFRRLLYTSVAIGHNVRSDQIDILRQSRANNGLGGISGVLWSDNQCHLQVLEGPPEAVAAVFERIAYDERHHDLRVLVDAVDSERVFSDWAMASLLPGETDAELRTRLGRLLRSAPEDVKIEFETAVAASH